MSDANNMLLGSGAKVAKFPTIGTIFKGVICEEPSTYQQAEMDGTKKVWKDGSPMEGILILLQTDEREDGDDDGRRSIYVEGGKFTAVKAAVRKAGVGLSVGGEFAIKYTADGTPSKPGYNAPKEYVAQYAPPTSSTNDLLGAADMTSPAAGVAADDLLG